MRRNRHELDVTAPVFRNNLKCRKLILDPVRISTFLVHLVDGNNQRNTSCPRMIHRFLGLRHHAIVSRDYQDNDISALSTSRPHGSKGRVTRRIQEGNHAVTGFNVISTDVLGNTT